MADPAGSLDGETRQSTSSDTSASPWAGPVGATFAVSETDDGHGGRAVTVVVDGELDASSGVQLRTLLSETIDSGPSSVVLDFAGLTFIDSVGLSVVVAGYKRSDAAGVGFELHDLSPSCRRVFEITRLTDVLTIRP